jgi:mannose-6-phosphate isomerase-like protein (cupin superfamily)
MFVANVDEVPAATTDTGTQLRVLMDTTERGQGRLSLAIETLAPGQRTMAHWHGDLEEIYYILTGQGELTIGGEIRAVRAGDVILIPLDQVHCLRNTGDGQLTVLCPVSPPWYPEDYHTERKPDG